MVSFIGKTIKNKKILSTITLFLASFFLPFGYDVLFLMIMELTNSFWITDGIFYLTSGFFFILYILLQKSINKQNKNSESNDNP